MSDTLVIVASYTREQRFRVPKGYTEEQIKKMISEYKLGVKWGVLYMDIGGKDLAINPHVDFEDGFKRPDDIQVEQAEDYDLEEDERKDWDAYLLELNHGNCFNEGRHPDTNDEEDDDEEEK